MSQTCMVSVIVPVFNEEHYILETLKSIFSQQCEGGFEVLVADDGSTDQTLPLIKEHYRAALQSGRLKLIDCGGKGVSNARNMALDQAVGTYILFCDGDDLLGNGAMEKIVSRAEETNAELVIGRMAGFHPFGRSVFPATKKLAVMEGFIAPDEPLLYRTMMITAKLYRRDFLNREGIRFLPIAYSEDAAFYMTCVYHAKAIAGCDGDGVVIYEYRRRTFMETPSVVQRFTEKLWNDFCISNETVLSMAETCLYQDEPESIRKEKFASYQTGLKARFVENTIRNFWRYYWLCAKPVRESMTQTLTKLRDELPKDVWEQAAMQKNIDTYLGVPYRPCTQEQHFGVALILADSMTKREDLIWVIKAVCRQDFPSYCIVLNEQQQELLKDELAELENVFRKEEGGRTFSFDYYILISQPLGLQNTALSKLVEQVASLNEGRISEHCLCVSANVVDAKNQNTGMKICNKLRYYLPAFLRIGPLRNQRFAGSDCLVPVWTKDLQKICLKNDALNMSCVHSFDAVMIKKLKT